MQTTISQPQPLLDVLALLSPDSSKTTLRSWVEKGRVTVNGRTIKKSNTPLKEGDKIAVGKRTFFIDQEIEILYEDRDLAVIHKPAGLLSVATDFDKQFTAHTALKDHTRSKIVYPVHRLDRETSGVMVFAYTEAAREGLKELFQIHDIQREYYAIVEGVVTPPKGTWTSYLVEEKTYVVHSTPKKDEGKLAVTHYELLGNSSNFSLLCLKLETGRKNQIRVHCREAGHTVVGDKKYGSQKDPIGRVALHAHTLGFVHPLTKRSLRFTAPLPEAFYQLNIALRT